MLEEEEEEGEGNCSSQRCQPRRPHGSPVGLVGCLSATGEFRREEPSLTPPPPGWLQTTGRRREVERMQDPIVEGLPRVASSGRRHGRSESGQSKKQLVRPLDWHLKTAKPAGYLFAGLWQATLEGAGTFRS